MTPPDSGESSPSIGPTSMSPGENAHWEQIARDPDFRALLLDKAKFVAPATAFFLVYYFALPVLVGYALLTACGVGLSALLVRAARQARALLRSVVPHLGADATPTPAGPPSPVANARPAAARHRLLVGSIARRGPPLVAA